MIVGILKKISNDFVFSNSEKIVSKINHGIKITFYNNKVWKVLSITHFKLHVILVTQLALQNFTLIVMMINKVQTHVSCLCDYNVELNAM